VTEVRVFAPGRVNLMGGHSDYTGGLVLPMAIDLGTTITGTRGGDAVRLRSAEEPDDCVVPLDVTDARGVEPAWARYVAGVVVETDLRVGFDGHVSTTLPVGTGLSSSAALEVAVALALGADDDGLADRPQLAEVLRRAEHRASGVPCGVMDQLASLCGVEGHAVLLDCHTLDVSTVAVPHAAEIVVLDSGQRRSLAGVPYAARRDETVAAAELLGGLGAPQHATVADVEAIDDPVLRRRARHVVTENRRVRDFCAALRGGDLAGAGELMTESHASLRDDQDVTTPALDQLVDRLVATPGVHGARLTGGGWGGCVVALCDHGALAGEGWHVRPAAGATVELTSA
jgi:galactokinase